MPRAFPGLELEALQLERLRLTLQQVSASSLYQKKYAEAGISPDTLTSLEDIRKLPFTTKQDLREHYPYGLLCVSQRSAGASPCLFGHDRAVHRGPLHQSGSRGLGGPAGTVHVHDRSTSWRYFSESLRLWSLHRRPGLSVWGRTPGAPDHPLRFRQQQAPDPAHAGLLHQHHPHHPQLCSAPDGCDAGTRG